MDFCSLAFRVVKDLWDSYRAKNRLPKAEMRIFGPNGLLRSSVLITLYFAVHNKFCQHTRTHSIPSKAANLLSLLETCPTPTAQ